MRKVYVLSSLIFLFALACGGDDGYIEEIAAEANDPRCQQICGEGVPQQGYGAQCSADSLELCVALCEQRVEGTSLICGSCLLDEAYLNGETCPLEFDESQSPQIRVFNSNGECFFQDGEFGGQHQCMQELCADETVDCSTEFPYTQSCADVCLD